MHGSIAMTGILSRTLLLLALLGINGCSSPAADSLVGAGDLGLIEAAMQQVKKSYVVPIKPDQLVNGALKGMLSKLDPHSDYMTEREYRDLISPHSCPSRRVGIQ